MMRYDLSGRVLIIDEAQNLKLQAFRELLHLHDFSSISLIFSGNDEVLKRVNTDKGVFAQINRRVPIRAEVNSILDEDTDRIANAFAVEGMDAYKMLRPIGRAYHTDGVVSILEIARRFAGEKAIKLDHIRRACEPFPTTGAP
jgi:DNA transposition AAA+ family ATPase